MNTASVPAVIDFEVYLLMTMKLRLLMSHKQAQLEAKLAQHGLSVGDAERIHAQVAQTLDNEASRFENMKKLLRVSDQDPTSLKYSSAFWPEFDFNAITGDDGLVESARYLRARGHSPSVGSPTELPLWSTDVAGFMERFGPMRGSRQWPLFDKLLPAYEEYEFLWNGESYGAGFSWGLFIFSAKSWPED